MNEHVYVAIMAGGVGTRFWPLSRRNQPKQFLDVLQNGQTLLQATYNRFAQFIPESHIYIITSLEHVTLVKEQLPNLAFQQILAEPQRRNTAPCIAYMANKLATLDENATFIVSPSDHLIDDVPAYIKALQVATDYAASNPVLMTLGIAPTMPHTGYGYIQFDTDDYMPNNIHKVKNFTEKPSQQIAQAFFSSNEFLWNAGIFVWNVKTICEAFKMYHPELYELFNQGLPYYNKLDEATFIAHAYAQCPNISIDYAIMEYAKNTCVLPASFGCSDLGTWASLWDKLPKDTNGNAPASGKLLRYDCENCLVVAPENKIVVLQGLQDYCVIDSDNALLICKIEEVQTTSNIYNDIKRTYGDTYI